MEYINIQTMSLALKNKRWKTSTLFILMPTIFLWTAHYNMFWHVIAFLVQCKIEFYFTHEPQNLYFNWWFPPLVKILHLVFIQWNKSQSDWKNQNILYILWHFTGLCKWNYFNDLFTKKKKKMKRKTLKLPKSLTTCLYRCTFLPF